MQIRVPKQTTTFVCELLSAFHPLNKGYASHPLPKINNIPVLLYNKFQESIQDHAYELVARHTRDTGLFVVKTILHSYSMELVTFQSQMGNEQRSTILRTTVTSNLRKILRIG